MQGHSLNFSNYLDSHLVPFSSSSGHGAEHAWKGGGEIEHQKSEGNGWRRAAEEGEEDRRQEAGHALQQNPREGVQRTRRLQ